MHTVQVSVGGEERRQVVGYLTVYEYYAYGRTTNHKRPRIAQMVGGRVLVPMVLVFMFLV